MSNLDSLVLEPIEQPLSNTPNMLSNEDRVLCNMTPLQRLYSIDEDTYEELVCVWAYSCLGNKGYTEVYRVGQAGDKGRDVLAYYDMTSDIICFESECHIKGLGIITILPFSAKGKRLTNELAMEPI